MPDAFRAEHPEVKWKALIATRDRAAHLYNLIDWDVIFITISRDIPNDARAIRAAIAARAATE